MLRKNKTLRPVQDLLARYLPVPRLVGRGGAISKDILKFARWPHCRRNTAKNTAKNAETKGF